MKRITLAGCLVVGSAAASAVFAATPGLIDRPTPPPCAADGTCYPNTKAWGYYPARWRTWPGVSLEPIPATSTEPTPPGGQISPELTPHETPPAELEDAAAPPASTKRQRPAPPTQEGPAEEEEETPSESPPAPRSAGPTSDADPPPAFPLSLAPRPRKASAYTPSPRTPVPASATTANDPPPAPPWGHRASL